MSMRERKRAPGHPGGVLKRLTLDALNVSNSRLASCIGVSRKTISKIVNEKGTITPDMALRLSRALSTTPDLWLNLQKNHDLWQASHKSADWQKVQSLTPVAASDPDGSPLMRK
jgi:addiction module HigA family antidote